MAGLDVRGIGRKVKAARERAGLTQAQLAEAAAITDETISRLERGAFEPALSTMVALADALGVGLDELLGRSGPGSRRKAAASPLATRLAEQAATLPAPAQKALLVLAKLLAGASAKPVSKK